MESATDPRATAIPAIFVSHKRGQRIVHPNYSLLRIEHVQTRADAEFFLGNGVVSLYEAGGKKMENRGRICRLHGNSGVLAAKFERNLPPKSIGKEVLVKLYKVDEDDY